MTELGGTRVLVTGATSGLGLAMARALVEAGARVAVTSRDADRAGHAAAELGPRRLGPGARRPRRGCRRRRGRRSVWERLGGIDLLVNNAGIGMRTVNPRFLSDPQPFWEVAPAGFRDVLETKVTGCFLDGPRGRAADARAGRRAGRHDLDERGDDGAARLRALRPVRRGGRGAGAGDGGRPGRHVR